MKGFHSQRLHNLLRDFFVNLAFSFAYNLIILFFPIELLLFPGKQLLLFPINGSNLVEITCFWKII